MFRSCVFGRRDEELDVFGHRDEELDDLRYLCRMGDINKAQQLMAKHAKLRYTAVIENMLYNACYYGRLDLVTWLYPMYENIPFFQRLLFGECCTFNMFFETACTKGGNVDVAKWLWSHKQHKPKTLLCEIDHIFRVACANGNLDLAKWLLSIKPSIDISEHSYYAYRRACLGNKTDVVNWLLSIYPELKNVDINMV